MSMLPYRLIHYGLRVLFLFGLMALPALGLISLLADEASPWRAEAGWLAVPLLIVALILAWVWQRWQEKRFLARPRDVQRAFAHLVCLGDIPPLQSTNARPLLLSPADDAAATQPFETLYASVQLAFTFSNQQYLLVTSADRGEGKSLVAANLAQACAQGGRRVLLIDGHWESPSQHHYFGLPRRRNLATFLQRVADMVDLRSEARALVKLVDARPQLSEWLSRVVQPTAQPHLFVLSNGAEPVPSALRHPVLFRGVLEAALNQFDLIICDGPPMLARDEGWRALAVMGEVLLVAAAYHTRYVELYTAIETLRRHPIGPIGVVLNHRKPDAAHRQIVQLMANHTPTAAAESAPSSEPPRPVTLVTPDSALPLPQRVPLAPYRNGKHTLPPTDPEMVAATLHTMNGNGHAAAPVMEKVETEAAAAWQQRLDELEQLLGEKERLLAEKEVEMAQFFQAQTSQNDLFVRLGEELAAQKEENKQLQGLYQQQNEDFFLLEQTARGRIQELEQKLASLQTRFQQASVTIYRRLQETPH